MVLPSTLSPYTPVEKNTITGWMKNTLSKSGINVSIFTSRSTRSASTSKAKFSGLLVDILKRGNWLKNSTWQKHYHNFI